jgi:hypothetical protein
MCTTASSLAFFFLAGAAAGAAVAAGAATVEGELCEADAGDAWAGLPVAGAGAEVEGADAEAPTARSAPDLNQGGTAPAGFAAPLMDGVSSAISLVRAMR